MNAIRLAVVPVLFTAVWAIIAGWCLTQLSALPGPQSFANRPAEVQEQMEDGGINVAELNQQAPRATTN